MNIAVCFDRNYQKWATVCLYSIWEQHKNSSKIRLVILSDIKFRECIWQLKKVLRKFEYTFDNPGNDFDLLPTGFHFNVTAYWRLALPQVLTKYGIEKAIYLDSDTIVLENMSELFKLDLRGNACGGCLDISSDELVKWLGLKQGFAINSGLLLMDVVKMNSVDWVVEATRLSEEERITWVDQDVINILLDENILLIDIKWNIQSGNFIHGYNKKVNIVHFTEAKNSKPWSENCKHPYFGFYKTLMKKSGFYLSYYKLKFNYYKKKVIKIS